MAHENIFYRGVQGVVTSGIGARRAKLLPEAMSSPAKVEIFYANKANFRSASGLEPRIALLPITTPDYLGGPAPILKDVKITLDGDYMTLKRAEFSISITKNEAAFFDIDEKILYPGAPIRIKYRSTLFTSTSDSGEFEGLVYDYSFTVKPGREYNITVKAVGKGNELMEANVLDTSQIRKLDLEYVSNYEEQARVPVQTLFDYLDYDVQNAFGKLNTAQFDATSGDSRKGKASVNGLDYSDAGFCVLDIDPELYGNAQQIRSNVGTGWFDGPEKSKLMYVTLQYVTWLVNSFVKPAAAKRYEIICDKNITVGDLKYTTQDGYPHYIVSADPFTIGLCTDIIPAGIPWKYNKASIRTNGVIPYDFYVGRDDSNNSFIFFSFFRPTSDNVYGITDSDAFTVKDGNLARILINRDVLRALEAKHASGTEKTTTMSIEKFFRDLFDIIKANTGGAVDLFLMADPDNTDTNVVRFFVRNGSEPQGTNKRTVLSFSPLDHITAEYSLTSKVPKDVAAAAFGGAPSSTGDADTISSAIRGEAPSKQPLSGYPTFSDLHVAVRNVAAKSFSTEGTSALQSLLKSLVSDEPPTEKAKRKAIPFPIELTLRLYGIEGLRFGDAITFDDSRLPKRYRAKDNGGFQLIFTITRIEHVLTAEAPRRWFTDVTAVPRLADSVTVQLSHTKNL